MQTWVLYAVLSMIFAGVTAVLAKYGLQNISADTGLAVRTVVIFAMVTLLTLVNQKYREIGSITGLQMMFLVLSGITTTLSWIFYYRAIKDGPVSYVAVIDKGSVVVTLLLSFLLLKEPASPKVIVGGLLVTVGVIVLTWK